MHDCGDQVTTTPTDRPIHLMTAPPSEVHSDSDLVPFIPQSPTLRPLTERPITVDDLRKYRETVHRAHRMIESALDKLIGA